MSLHHFSNDFAKQFRNECALYSPIPEYQYGKILLMQFAGDDAEMAITGERLTEKFFNGHLINQILLTLKNDNFPAARRLFNNVIALKKECEVYLRLEPYTGHYYREHISMFGSFSELIHAFNVDFCEHVYDPLNKYFATISQSLKGPAAESTSLTDVIELTEFYLKNLLAYYNYFIAALQSEASNNNSSKKSSVQLTTYMADHLQALIVNTEEMITCIEETRSLLLTWEEQMEIKEWQELYN